MLHAYLDSGALSQDDKKDILIALRDLEILRASNKLIMETPAQDTTLFKEALVLLTYEGSLQYKTKTLAFAKFFAEKGYNTISKGLFVRVQEGIDLNDAEKQKESGIREVEPFDFSVEIEDEEEAPMTQRSRVAKLLGHSTAFYKAARK